MAQLNDLLVLGKSSFIDKATFNNDLDINGDTTVNGDILVNGDTSANGELTVSGKTTIDDELIVNDAISGRGGLNLDGGAIIDGGLSVESGAVITGRYYGSGDDEGLVITPASSNNYAGLTLGNPSGVRSVMYLLPSTASRRAIWRYNNGTASYDISHPVENGEIIVRQSWSAKVKGNTWSRLCSVAYANSVVGASYILNVAATRGNVVYNDTYLIKVHHSKNGKITKISGSNYSTGYQIRMLSDSNGNSHIELNDNCNNITTGTEQTVYCRLLPIYSGAVTKYEAFTSGNVPSDYTAHTFTTDNSDIQGNTITSNIFNGNTFNQGGYPLTKLYSSLVPFGTAIPANANLNDLAYLKVGNYYCSANATAATLINSPLSVAFRMEVSSPLSTTIENEETKTYVYRLRKIIAYNTGREYIQYCSSGSTAGVWTYGKWYIVPQASYTIDEEDTNGGSAALGSKTNPVYLSSAGVLTACGAAASGVYHTFVPSVNSDGVMEVGKYIDFHEKASTYDNDVRLSVTKGDASGQGTLSVSYKLTTGNALTVSAGGATITGNSKITGTLTTTKKLTVSSGGLTVTAGGLTVSAGGAAITGDSTISGTLSLTGNATITKTAGSRYIATTTKHTVWFGVNADDNAFGIYNDTTGEKHYLISQTSSATTINAQGNRDLTLASSKAITMDSASGNAITITSGSTLYLNNAANTSIIFKQGGTEIARFNTQGHLVLKKNLTTDGSITAGTGITVTTGGITVSAGGADITGSITASGSITAGDSSATDDRLIKVVNKNGSVGILTSTNRGLYDVTKSGWIIYRLKDKEKTLIPGVVGVGDNISVENGYITSDTTLYLSSAANTSTIFRQGTTELARFNTSGYLVLKYNSYMDVTNRGYFLVDKKGNEYPGVYDNGSNLWIGSTQSATSHHVGYTYISTGYTYDKDANGNELTTGKGNTSIYVSVPKAGNTSSDSYLVFHTGYLNVGYATHGTLAIGRGGTGSTTRAGAMYNLLNGMEYDLTSSISDATNIMCRYVTPSTSNGGIYARKASTIKDYVLSGVSTTDNKTLQSRSTATSWRPILGHATHTTQGDDPGNITAEVYYNENLSFKPSSGMVFTYGGVTYKNKTSSVSGGFTVQSSDDKYSISLLCGSGQVNRGLYDNNASDWVIYRGATSKVTYLKGGVVFSGSYGPSSSKPSSPATGQVYFQYV